MSATHIRFILALALLAVGAPAKAADENGFFSRFERADKTRWYVSNGWANGDHQGCEWRAEEVRYENSRVQLGLSDRWATKRPYACAEIQTHKRSGYGLYEARLRTAAGSGLNTGFFTYVGPPLGVPEWDEIDFEFLGKDPGTVDINYWTNGKTQLGKKIQLGFDASRDFHNYAFDWSPTGIRYYADGKLIYETPPDAKIPHNPGKLFLTLWSGAKAQDDWMGPFQYKGPVSAEVEWAAYTPPNAPCQFPESLKCKQ
ncbi:MAG: family 16 glycosylhydrolase [Bdellovibrionales bacterium]